MAAVPELNAATCTSSAKYSVKSFSNPFTFGPKGATQLVSKASCINFCSSPPMCGVESHIFSFIIFLWLYRSEEHTSELQSRGHLVCRLLLEKKKIIIIAIK